MRYTHIRFATVMAVLVASSSATAALADDLSGSYQCTTRTGIRLNALLIQNNDQVTGTYIGVNDIAGYFSGSLNNQGMLVYNWHQNANDAGNDRYDGGWGNMTFTDRGLNAAWGRPSNGSAVGFWSCTRVLP